MNQEFWRDKRVLITGNNGFKGCWLNKWLDMLGADTCGISLRAEKESVYHELLFSERQKYYELDIRDGEGVNAIIREYQPQIVFHLAAQAIVKIAAEKPVDTFSSNVMGLVNVLEALRSTNSVRAIVAITSDKVYENTDRHVAFTEDSRLGGDEPYSASKACQEMVVKAYRDTYFAPLNVGIATARASNTFGGGDNHFDRLIPYLIKAVHEKQPIRLRNPEAVRPWQYILDLLRGYMCLAECLYDNPEQFSGPYNFGPLKEELYTVGEIAAVLQQTEVERAEKTFHEAAVLMIDSEKSRIELQWEPKVRVPEGMQRTQRMYEAYFSGESMNVLMEEEIGRYADVSVS